MVNILIWTCVLVLGTLLFYKSSGTLNPCKINIISLTYYYIMIQTIMGALLTSFGFTGHYTYLRLSNPEKYVQMGGLYAVVTLLLIPIVSIIMLKAFKINPQTDYSDYLDKELDLSNSTFYFYLIMIFSILSSLFLIILLCKIGYIPIWKLLTNRNFDFVNERHRNVSLAICGVEQFKNIFVLYGIPVLSLIAFSFALATKQRRWKVLFGVLLLESLIVKTYDFSKAPLVIYFFMLALVIIYNKGGISYKLGIFIGSIGIIMLIASYRLVGYSNSFFDIYNGILGRTIFTQFGTLCMHFEAFSEYIGLLDGRSLYPTILSLLGIDPEMHIRSAEVVMELYNPEGFYEGNTGVMNSLFIGEAYANWGRIGVIISIIWVAIVITMVFIIFLKLRKNPITVAFCVILTQQLTTCIQGGFVDYIYSSSIIITIIGMLILYYLPKFVEKLSDKSCKPKE